MSDQIETKPQTEEGESKSGSTTPQVPGGIAANDRQQAVARQQNLEDEEARQKETEKLNLGAINIIRLYAIPLIVVVIFSAIVFTLIIPGISSIFTLLSKADALDKQNVTLTNRLIDLQQLSDNSSQIQANLASIGAIIPERVTQVVNFQQKITRIARQEFNLNVTQAETGETLLTSAVESADDPAAEVLAIIEIPSIFSMSGTLNNIKGFINAIQKTDDFIIIGEMELSSNSNTSNTPISSIGSGEWRLDITLIKYQFPVPNENNNLQELYSRVSPSSTIDPEVLEYVRNKIALGQ